MQSFLGLYHVEGRVIPALEISGDNVVDGLRAFAAKTTTSSESILFSSNIIERHEL